MLIWLTLHEGQLALGHVEKIDQYELQDCV